MPKVCPEIGDKYISNTLNNLAVLFFCSKLQLIHNFLTNSLIPPTPRSPTNLEDNSLNDLVGRAAACQCQKRFETNCNKRKYLSTDVLMK